MHIIPVLKKLFLWSFVSCLFFFSETVHAQKIFQKTYGGPILDWSNQVIQMADSNFILLGSTKNYGAGNEDVYLMKIDQSGDTLWSVALGDTGDDESRTIVQTSDGGFVISGTTRSVGAGGDDIFLMKIDSAANIIWTKSYGGPNVDFCFSSKACKDGGYILGGCTTSYGNAAGSSDIYLIRTDDAGDTIWTHTYGSSAVEEGHELLQTADSGFIVAGFTMVNGTKDMLVLKTDGGGNTQWLKTFGGNGTDVAYGIVETNDGYCIGGSTASFSVGGDLDVYMVKIDFGGDTLWSRTFGTSDSDECRSIKQTIDSGFIMTGFANKVNNVFDDVLFLKTNATGQITCESIFGTSTSARDVGLCVIPTFDNGFLVSGYTQSFGNGTQIYLVKMDFLGFSGCNQLSNTLTTGYPATVVGNFPAIESHGSTTGTITSFVMNNAPGVVTTLCTAVPDKSVAFDQLQSSVAPNPFTDFTDITISGVTTNTKLLFTVSNIMGIEVVRYLIDFSNDYRFKFYKDHLAPGIYIYRVTPISSSQRDQSNSIITGKLIIQ